MPACQSTDHEGDSTVDEVCADGFCRECHVSLSFEDCVNGTWVAEQRKAGGLSINAEQAALLAAKHA